MQKTLVLLLCGAASACSASICLVTTPSPPTNQPNQTRWANAPSSLENNHLTLENSKSPVADVSAADLSDRDNGQ